ncbi:acyltransferase family protein [Bradyrhizobium sp. AUGA SZCCT0283]|nr:acyltransferase family protein [Bradyrhizobium sp. AUGA SZCCT0283]
MHGWAALVVIPSHVFQVWMLNPEAMQGRGLTGVLDFVNSTPLGVMMDGTLAVHVFCCISGVALTYPIRTSEHRRMTAIVLLMQRYPRLTIPIFMSCIAAYLLWIGGCFRNAEAAVVSNSHWLALFYRFERTHTTKTA